MDPKKEIKVICKGAIHMVQEFVSKLEEIMPAEELNFPPTPVFGKYGAIMPEEAVCFDEQTEILTKDEWKKYSELKKGELVATLNPETHEIEYHPIKEIYIMCYTGKMYKLKDYSKKKSNLLSICSTLFC